MNNKLCVDLNLNIHPMASGVDIRDLCRNPPGSAHEYNLHTYIEPKFLNSELIELTQNLGLTLIWSECFYTNPKQFTGIHVDHTTKDYVVANNDIAKLNFVFGGKDSVMLWYSPKVANHSFKVNRINSTYISYTLDQVDLVHETVVGFPSLVQAGIPHNIKNGPEGRFCLSLSFIYDSNIPVGMNHAQEIFKNFTT